MRTHALLVSDERARAYRTRETRLARSPVLTGFLRRRGNIFKDEGKKALQKLSSVLCKRYETSTQSQLGRFKSQEKAKKFAKRAADAAPRISRAEQAPAKAPAAKTTRAKKVEKTKSSVTTKAPAAKKRAAKPVAKKRAAKPAAKKRAAKPSAAAAPKPAASAGDEMTYLEFVGGTSAKFWQIKLSGTITHVTNGRIGGNGQSQMPKSHVDAATARNHYEEMIASKLKKGYCRT